MGQSQLLLIIIGVLIIGIILLAATGFFRSDELDANKNALVHDINQVAQLGLRYFARPLALGGGGHSYVGFQLPARFQSNSNGKYTATAPSPTMLEVTGISALDSSCSVTAQIDTYGKASNWTFTGDFQ